MSEKESKGLRLRSDCAEALVCIVGKKLMAPDALQRYVYGASAAADERDRGFAKEIVMGVLRWRGTLMRLLELMSRKSFFPFKDNWSLMVMLSGMYQVLLAEKIPRYAAVSSTVELLKSHSGKKTASFANALLRRCSGAGRLEALISEVAPDQKNTILWASYPRWFRRRLERIYGEVEALGLAMAMNERPHTFVRVDRMDAGEAGEKIRRRFPEASIRGGRWLPTCLVVKRGGDLRRVDLHAKGYITVQDEASQIAGRALGAEGNDRVLDVCSGMGIKSGQIAVSLRGGTVVALDRNPRKVRLLAGEANRLKVGCIQPACADSTSLPFKSSSRFNRILVDAPCSGTGSLARKPEIKYRLRKSDPSRMSGLQEQILSSASRFLEKDGLLLYSVCSILPEEGREVIDRFLHKNRGFRLVRPPHLPSSLIQKEEEDTLLLLPTLHGTEGFFMAALTK